MPKAEFSTKEVKSLLKTPVETEKLKEKVPMLGVDMESIDDEKIIIEVFPNRPDMLSIEGFSRALSSFMEIKSGMIKYSIKENNPQIEIYIDPSVKNIRPYISAAVIRNVKLDDNSLKSIMDIQEKLHITHGRGRKKAAIGVHDLDTFKPPLKYKAFNPDEIKFRPLNLEKELYLNEILEKHPKGREYAHILGNTEKYPVIADNQGKVLSMPPIINSDLTKVTEKTKNLFIEVTGTELKTVNQALKIITTSIADRTSGEIKSINLIEQ